MSRNTNRQEALQLAAERMRQKKEKEEREENEFFERITSGKPWLIFKAVVVFCTLIALLTTIDVLVDGPSKKISENDYKIDQNWEWTWHKIVDVEGYLFAPQLRDWSDHVENTIEITYSPIFRTGKKLKYDIQDYGSTIRKHEQTRWRSMFTWFPAVQLFLLIPLLTFIFKRQKPWFNFARILSLVVVFPGTFLLIYFAIY